MGTSAPPDFVVSSSTIGSPGCSPRSLTRGRAVSRRSVLRTGARNVVSARQGVAPPVAIPQPSRRIVVPVTMRSMRSCGGSMRCNASHQWLSLHLRHFALPRRRVSSTSRRVVKCSASSCCRKPAPRWRGRRVRVFDAWAAWRPDCSAFVPKAGHHLIDDLSIVEPREAHGAPVAQARYRGILLTNLFNPLLPIIRYAIFRCGDALEGLPRAHADRSLTPSPDRRPFRPPSL